MKKAVFLSLFLAFLLCGCNNQNPDSEAAQITENTVSESTEESTSESEVVPFTEIPRMTAIVSEESEKEKKSEKETEKETQKQKESAEESSETEKITEKETSVNTSGNVIRNDKEDSGDYADTENLIISVHSDRITEKCEGAVAGYFRALENCDSTKYLSYLPPVYRDYFLEYLKEQNFTVQQVLQKNYEKTAQAPDTSFSYKKITLEELTEEKRAEIDYPDFAADYLQQLDEISQEKSGYNISEKFTDCFSILCTTDISIENSDKITTLYNIVITVFEYEDSYYIIMA